jgi:DNA-3-methyladenine glycosylase II
MTPRYWRRATQELATRDPVLAGLIRAAPAARLRRRSDAFRALARSIVGQQISVRAAAGVWQRLCDAFEEVAPRAFAVSSVEQLRAIGLSRRKAAYLCDLALHFQDGRLAPERWVRMDDEAVVAELTRVKGIGRWTAEMFLIFYLLRPNVLPLGDLGLRRAVSLHYNRGRAVSEVRLQRVARVWVPWRSVATWYLWRSLDPIPVEY